MRPKKGRPSTDGHTNQLHNCSTGFLDVEVSPDGKRKTGPPELTPEDLKKIVEALPAKLDSLHFSILRTNSSISAEVVEARSPRSITADNLQALQWFGMSQKYGPALVLPYFDQSGHIVQVDLRFDRPARTPDGKTLRYLSPAGLPKRLDFPRNRPFPDDGEIWLVEGLKKADSARSRGLYAIGLPGIWCLGVRAKEARADLEALHLEGRTVIVVFDTETKKKSQTAVKKARASLCRYLAEELGADPKIAILPEPADGVGKTGLDDFFASGASVEDLFELVQGPEPSCVIGDELDAAEALGNEDDLIFAGQRFWRYSDADGIWMETPDESIKRALQLVCREGGVEIKDSFIRGAFGQAKARFFRQVEFDRTDSRSIPASNGVLRFVDGGWSPSLYRREDYRRIKLPVKWDPDAKCPRFEKFLEEVFAPLPGFEEGGKEDARQKILALLEFIGLSLTATTEFETALLMVGEGGNGKSVLIRLMEAMTGARNRAAVQMKQLDNRFQRAHLDGKLINIMSELPEGAEVPDAEIKAIISGEPITAEHKMRPPFEFHPTCKLWIATNHMPGVRDFSDGLFRRFLILKFENRFDNRPNKDTRLSEKLIAESSGILNYALKALEGVFRRGGLTKPESSISSVESWRKDADQVVQFIDEEAVLESGAFTPSAILYEVYTAWAKASGIRRLLGKKGLTQRLIKFGVIAGQNSAKDARGLYGIRLSEVRSGNFR